MEASHALEAAVTQIGAAACTAQSLVDSAESTDISHDVDHAEPTRELFTAAEETDAISVCVWILLFLRYFSFNTAVI